MTSSFAGANPLLGLTSDEYEDFASALVRYVAHHATVDQTTYFVKLCRDYAREIAARVAAGGRAGRPLVPVPARGQRPGPPAAVRGSLLKKPRSH